MSRDSVLCNGRRFAIAAAAVWSILMPCAAFAAVHAAPDTYTTANGVVVTTGATGVLANDQTTVSGATLAATLVTPATHGELVFNGDGSFAYAAAPGFAGADTFTYVASDGRTASQTTTVTVTTGVRASDDHYGVDATAGTLAVAAPGVLANDRTASGAMTATLVSAPVNGTLALNANGGFSYTPGPSFTYDAFRGFVGSDSFTYRVTTAAGASAIATVTLANEFSILHEFAASPIDPNIYPDSLVPAGNLVRGPDGKFYGATNGDGCLDGGNVFRIEPDGSLTVLKRFSPPATLQTTGCVPNPLPNNATYFPGNAGVNATALMRATDGNLYGTTEFGGDYFEGTIYRLVFTPGSADPSFESLHSFDCSRGEGLDPFGMLVEGPDGALYGTNGVTNADFTGCWGSTAFKINKDGSGFQVLASFSGLDASVGFYTLGPVAVGADGTVYGTSRLAAGAGSVFMIRPGSQTPIALHNFNPFAGEGALPTTGLVRGLDGAMYGTAEYAAADLAGTVVDASSAGGTIFRITEDGDFKVLFRFDGAATNLFAPKTPLRRGGDGRLYGGTFASGILGSGGLYQFDLPMAFGGPGPDVPSANAPYGGRLRVLHEFDPANDGFGTWGQLGVGSDRHIYGVNAYGGRGSGGTVFGPVESAFVANNPPVANISYTAPNPAGGTTGSPLPVEASGPAGALVTLSSIGSSDEDFDPLSFKWTQSGASGFSAATTSQAPYGLNYSTATGVFPIGTTRVALTVDDGQAHTISPLIPDLRTRTIDVVVRDTLPPTVTVVATGKGAALDATGPNGAVATFAASATDLVDGTRAVTCDHASGSMFPLGTTTVTCQASDTRGNVGVGTLTITVHEARPTPLDCAGAVAQPSVLWPPNHQFVPISVAGVSAADGSPIAVKVTSIFQDEPTDIAADGSAAIDGFGLGTPIAFVRADRNVLLNGRVYRIAFTAAAGGASCSGEVTVGVPRDRGTAPVAIDDGPKYDSTKPTR